MEKQAVPLDKAVTVIAMAMLVPVFTVALGFPVDDPVVELRRVDVEVCKKEVVGARYNCCGGRGRRAF